MDTVRTWEHAALHDSHSRHMKLSSNASALPSQGSNEGSLLFELKTEVKWLASALVVSMLPINMLGICPPANNMWVYGPGRTKFKGLLWSGFGFDDNMLALVWRRLKDIKFYTVSACFASGTCSWIHYGCQSTVTCQTLMTKSIIIIRLSECQFDVGPEWGTVWAPHQD
jgi:hypothetical protein